VPILEDVGGETALDYALKDEENLQRNAANQILKGIENYPFMHSGFTIVSGILKAFKYCPNVGHFLDKRLVVSEHFDCTSMSRKCLDPKTALTHAEGA
jgi:hypothetical protein